MELQKISAEMQELSFDEASSINGGESAWYWLGYAIGATAHFIYEAATSEPIRPSTYR
jgi:hypothetical protein